MPAQTPHWQPQAQIAHLHQRAAILQQIRHFFAQAQVLEVEVPLVGRGGSCDPWLDSYLLHTTQQPLYLQTSPEFYMKRLLCAGSGPIWTHSRCFRRAEVGRYHHPEFSMLEWYRPDWSLADLQQEVEALVNQVLGVHQSQTLTYVEAMQTYAGLHPLRASTQEIQQQAVQILGYTPETHWPVNEYLDVIFTQAVEPQLHQYARLWLTEFPASQAALARTFINAEGDLVAARAELYIQGIEIANAYHELQDAKEQARRFQADREQRQALAKEDVLPDYDLLAALEAGLPECSGVALGLDRLCMLAFKVDSLAQAMSFTWAD